MVTCLPAFASVGCPLLGPPFLGFWCLGRGLVRLPLAKCLITEVSFLHILHLVFIESVNIAYIPVYALPEETWAPCFDLSQECVLLGPLHHVFEFPHGKDIRVKVGKFPARQVHHLPHFPNWCRK